MVEHKPTPEEQLLKLIETPQTGAATPASPAAEGAKATQVKKGKAPALGKLWGAFSFAKAQFFKKKFGGQFPFAAFFEIRQINKVLLAFVLASGVYLAVDLILSRPAQTDFLSQVSTSEPVYPVFKEAQDASRDLPYYKEPLRRRHPFLPPGGPAIPVQAASLPPPVEQGPSPFQGLKLVGISTGEEPLAMIEDETTGRTYFLKRGQEVREVKIQSITKEKVVVTYDGQEGELF